MTFWLHISESSFWSSEKKEELVNGIRENVPEGVSISSVRHIEPHPDAKWYGDSDICLKFDLENPSVQLEAVADAIGNISINNILRHVYIEVSEDEKVKHMIPKENLCKEALLQTIPEFPGFNPYAADLRRQVEMLNNKVRDLTR